MAAAHSIHSSTVKEYIMSLVSKWFWRETTNAPHAAPAATQRIPVAAQPGDPLTSRIKHVLMSDLTDAGDAAIAAAVASGTYLPVASALVNADIAIPYTANFVRVGNNVTVFGVIDLRSIGTGTPAVRLTLPIAHTFSNEIEAFGTFVAGGGHLGVILAVAATQLAIFNWTVVDVVYERYSYSFSYNLA
jgi:hypothetical protein